MKSQGEELEASRGQREREALERRETYVSRVFIWQELAIAVSGSTAEARQEGRRPQLLRIGHLRNTGATPVYDVIFCWRVGDGPGHYASPGLPLMPGAPDLTEGWAIPPDTDAENVSVVAFIRDAAGNCWRLYPNGSRDLLLPDQWPPNAW